MKKRALFIDRDGTLILEPEDEQIDSLEKLEFYPKVFRNLNKIKQFFDFELVMVTNQDGLGTDSFPEDTFWPAHNKILKAFENEGVIFDNILIDKSFPKDNLPTRKPRTGMLTKYISGDFDLENSFVIGDRLTDIELAKNLNAKGILLGKAELIDELKNKSLDASCALISEDWDEIVNFLASEERTAKVERVTKETSILIELDLDGQGKSDIATGLGFFDHMLEQISKHGNVGLKIKVDGDLHVDEHHTIEDTALALGEAFYKSLGSKRGIERYGYVIPMDESYAQAIIDFGGRPWIVWETEFKRERIGDMPTEMFYHFFKSFSDTAKCNLNIRAEGNNEHHKIEAIFKAFARAIKMAIKRDPFNDELPTTKGFLE